MIQLTDEMDTRLLEICEKYDVDLGQIRGSRGNQNVCDARGEAANALTQEGGMSRHQVATYLGRTESAVAAMLGSFAFRGTEGALPPQRAPGDPTDTEVAEAREARQSKNGASTAASAKRLAEAMAGKPEPAADPFEGLQFTVRKPSPQWAEPEESLDALARLFWEIHGLEVYSTHEHARVQCLRTVWTLMKLPGLPPEITHQEYEHGRGT